VTRINVIVVMTSPDIMAQGMAESIAARSDMELFAGRCLEKADVDDILYSGRNLDRCAIILIGHPQDTVKLQERWLNARSEMVIMRVDIVGDIVKIELRDPQLDILLTALRELVERFALENKERVAEVRLGLTGSLISDTEFDEKNVETPLLHASIAWIRALLRSAIESMPSDNGDVPGFAVTRTTVVRSLDPLSYSTSKDHHNAPILAEEALGAAFADNENNEPLAIAAKVFELESIEFRMMILALAPELDFHFQKCLGFLLDDLSRRVGTFGLFSNLLGIDPVELARIRGGKLAHWQVFDTPAGACIPADEPLRVDPFLRQWLLGNNEAFERDHRVSSVLHHGAWAGADLLTGSEIEASASKQIEYFLEPDSPPVLVLEGTALADWKAWLELGAYVAHTRLLRIDFARLAGLASFEIKDCALRIGRIASLTGAIPVVDLSGAESYEGLSGVIKALHDLSCKIVVIVSDSAAIIPHLGSLSFMSLDSKKQSVEIRVQAMRKVTAALCAENGSSAEDLVVLYPLDVAKIEEALVLAASRKESGEIDEQGSELFFDACKELSLQDISGLANRVDLKFTLDDVVLPRDRKDQLDEIIAHVRLASQVMDGWNFGEKLPYGRGVTALFSGTSGTGKTMAALATAERLGKAVLRIDLSKVVSKYIGETEKNISKVFDDAERSGAAILLDEADALLGKRSEVKEAHDRYANIEVAYLLQRIEAFEGLVILTTNMIGNLDKAFLRRLRFVIEFPKPDARAREEIWRQCLPDMSHELSDEDFRHLARRVELTGGQIRQITLRAAFIAAADGRRIDIEAISRATHAELTKLGMPPVELVREGSRRAA